MVHDHWHERWGDKDLLPDWVQCVQKKKPLKKQHHSCGFVGDY